MIKFIAASNNFELAIYTYRNKKRLKEEYGVIENRYKGIKYEESM